MNNIPGQQQSEERVTAQLNKIKFKQYEKHKNDGEDVCGNAIYCSITHNK